MESASIVNLNAPPAIILLLIIVLTALAATTCTTQPHFHAPLLAKHHITPMEIYVCPVQLPVLPAICNTTLALPAKMD